MKTRMVCAVSVLAASALAGAAQAQAPTAKDDVLVRYQTYNSINEVVFRVAEEKFCHKRGLKCEGVLIPSGPTGIQSLVGGSIQFAFVAADAEIRAIANGAGIKMVSGFIDRVPYHVVVRNDVPLPDKAAGYPAVIKDLKGKRIGVTGRGAGTELTFDLMVRQAGLAPTDVTYVAVGGPVTALGSLKSRQIDAAFLFQPMPGICKSSGVCTPVLDLTRGEGGTAVQTLDGASSTVIAKSEFIEKNPKVVEAFVAAFQDAEAWVKDPSNYEELKVIANKYIKLDVADASAIMDAGLKEQVSNTDTRIKKSAVMAYVELLYDRQLIPRKLELKDILWNSAPVR